MFSMSLRLMTLERWVPAMTTDRCFLQDSELAGKNWKHHFLANIKAC